MQLSHASTREGVTCTTTIGQYAAGMKNLSDDFNFKEKEKAQYTLLQFRGGKKRRTIYFHVQPKNFTKKHFIIKHKL